MFRQAKTLAFGIVIAACSSAISAELIPAAIKPISLPRLVDLAIHNNPALDVVNWETVSSVPGATAIKKSGFAYLQIDPNNTWIRPAHRTTTGMVYVTFTMHASLGSVVTTEGVRISIGRGGRQNYGALYYTEGGSGEIRSMKHEMPIRKFNKQPMITIAAATIAIDVMRSTWSFFIGQRPVLFDIPCVTKIDGETGFRLAVGDAGGWLCGLCFSDENPIFEDSNRNAIDDVFERNVSPQTVPASPTEARAELLRAWQKELAVSPLPPLRLVMPGPDRDGTNK